MLGDVGALEVVDLYAGTGALAIEALSRGATKATLVDVRPETAIANIGALGLEGRAEVLAEDALAYLRVPGPSFDLILCDPPYRIAARLGPELDQLLPPRLRPGGRIVIESSAREPLDLALEPWRERRYGEALLRIYRL